MKVGVEVPWQLSLQHQRYSYTAERVTISGYVQMIWGERRGHGTMGAVQRLPMELTHVATFSF
jgi:hypothetical protein